MGAQLTGDRARRTTGSRQDRTVVCKPVVRSVSRSSGAQPSIPRQYNITQPIGIKPVVLFPAKGSRERRF